MVKAKARRRALVVEDEPAINQICLRVLNSEGFEVDVTFNGQAAEEKLKEREDYDVVLVDIRTPIMNGKELYQHMKDNHPKLARRVIFATGDVMGGNTGRFLEESGSPFLPKPFTPDELAKIVKETLRQMEK